MATLTTTDFKGGLDRGKVSFQYTLTLQSETLTSQSNTTKVWRREVAGTSSKKASGVNSISGDTEASSLSGTITGTYTPVSLSATSNTATIVLTAYYTIQEKRSEYKKIKDGYWGADQTISSGTTTEQIPPIYPSYAYTSDGYIKYSYQYIPYGNQYFVITHIQEWIDPVYDWVTGDYVNVSGSTNLSITSTVGTYYKSPTTFTFHNCQTNRKWQIDKGLDDLIDNITDFQTAATQWRQWKDQHDLSGPCPPWGSGPLTAASLQKIHDYVLTGKTYSKGQIVAADMFNSLATKINTG